MISANPSRLSAWSVRLLRECAILNSRQMFVWSPVPLALGIAVYFIFPITFDAVFPTVFTVLAAGLFLAMGHRQPALGVVCLWLALSGLGLAVTILRAEAVQAPQLERELGPTVLEGRVIWVEQGDRRMRVMLDQLSIPELSDSDTPRKIRISSSARADQPPIGVRVSVRAVLLPPSGPVMPGGFDFRRAAYFQGLGATGYSVGSWQVEALPEDLPFALRLAETRKTIAQRVRTVLPGQEGAVATALLTGERYAIPATLQEAYRISGLAHLLAISGLHMSMLAAGVFMFVRRGCALSPRLAEAIDTKKLAAVAALGGTFAYLMLSGLGVSSQRAFIMVAIALLAILVARNPLSLRLVAVAAIAVLLAQPEAVMSVSFQMSFAAVVCLIAAYDALRRKGWLTSDKHRGWLGLLGFYLLGVLVTDFIAGSATAPYAAYHFNRLPSYSLIANVLAVPVMGLVVMPMAILTLAVLPFGLEAGPLMVMGQGIGMIDGIAQTVAAWPGASVRVPPSAPWALACLTFGGLILCLLRGPLRGIGVPLVVAACIQPWTAEQPVILVDGAGGGLAVRVSDGLVVSPGVASFSKSNWVRAYGQSSLQWDDFAKCDSNGCVIELTATKVAWSKTLAALSEDCQAVDIVIASEPIRQTCAATVSIGWFDLWRRGAHAIYLSDPRPRVHTVSHTVQPARPWVLERP